MVSKLKENPSGGYYCSECRMSTGELVSTCPFCGSWISNYEELASNSVVGWLGARNIEEAKEFIDASIEPPEIIVGGRWYEANIEEELTEEQKELLDKENNLQEAIINIRNRFGKNSILKGMNLEEKSTAIRRNSEVGGHKG